MAQAARTPDPHGPRALIATLAAECHLESQLIVVVESVPDMWGYIPLPIGSGYQRCTFHKRRFTTVIGNCVTSGVLTIHPERQMPPGRHIPTSLAGGERYSRKLMPKPSESATAALSPMMKIILLVPVRWILRLQQ